MRLQKVYMNTCYNITDTDILRLVEFLLKAAPLAPALRVASQQFHHLGPIEERRAQQ